MDSGAGSKIVIASVSLLVTSITVAVSFLTRGLTARVASLEADLHTFREQLAVEAGEMSYFLFPAPRRQPVMSNGGMTDRVIRQIVSATSSYLQKQFNQETGPNVQIDPKTVAQN